MKNNAEIPEPQEFPVEPDEYPSETNPVEPGYPDTPEPEPLQPYEPDFN